ncbi:MAG: hypothetical protein RL215_1964 [Planctomycetota bacterium]
MMPKRESNLKSFWDEIPLFWFFKDRDGMKSHNRHKDTQVPGGRQVNGVPLGANLRNLLASAEKQVPAEFCRDLWMDVEQGLGVVLVECLLSGFPVAGAEFIGLESIEYAEDFIDIASDAEVVDGEPAEDALGVDKVDAAVGDAFAAVEDIVGGGELVVGVADHEVFELAEFFVGVAPAFMGVHAVGAGGEYDGVAVCEFAESFIEGDDFGGADEGEVEGIEVEADPFAVEVGQFQVAELAVGVVFGAIISLECEISCGGWLTDANAHCDCLLKYWGSGSGDLRRVGLLVRRCEAEYRRVVLMFNICRSVSLLKGGNSRVWQLPVFDGAVGDFEEGGGNGASAFAMSFADGGGEFVEFGCGLKSSEPIFEVFGDAEFSAVPGGKFAKQCAGAFVVLVGHEFKVVAEEADLFVGGGFLFWQSVHVLLNAAKDPGIEHCSAANCDGSAAGFADHGDGICGVPDIAVGDDWHVPHRLHNSSNAIAVHGSVKALGACASVNGDGSDTGLFEGGGELWCGETGGIPAEPHFDGDGQLYRFDHGLNEL